MVGKISSDIEKERAIESTSGRYAAYLAVIRVIPWLSGELLEPNRAYDRRYATQGGEKGATWEEETRDEERMPCRSSRSSRDTLNKRGRQMGDPLERRVRFP